MCKLPAVVRCPLSVVSCLLSVVLLLAFASCSEWNTDSLGQSFVPANSQVHVFTHPVYVEYSADGVRVWGPYADEVECNIEGQHLSVTNTRTDSLALFVYGYTVTTDSLAPQADSWLTINSQAPYALYLGGLSLSSSGNPVIQSVSDATCHVVLPAKSRNTLYGPLCVSGEMTLSGTGSLTISSRQSAIQAASLQCQYGVTVKLSSSEAYGIDLNRSSMRSTMGTWYIDAALDAIHCPDTLLLTGGTYQGTSRQGSFFSSCAMLRRPTLLAAAHQQSLILDSAYVAMRYDSVQSVWQQQVDTLVLQADSLYQIYRQGSKSVAMKFTPNQSLTRPVVLISQSSILSTDTLQFTKTSQKKK